MNKLMFGLTHLTVLFLGMSSAEVHMEAQIYLKDSAYPIDEQSLVVFPPQRIPLAAGKQRVYACVDPARFRPWGNDYYPVTVAVWKNQSLILTGTMSDSSHFAEFLRDGSNDLQQGYNYTIYFSNLGGTATMSINTSGQWTITNPPRRTTVPLITNVTVQNYAATRSITVFTDDTLAKYRWEVNGVVEPAYTTRVLLNVPSSDTYRVTSYNEFGDSVKWTILPNGTVTH